MCWCFCLLAGLSSAVSGSEWAGIDGALRSAAYDGDVQRTIAALDEGAAIDSQTEPDKPTALMYAARNGRDAVVRVLLARGADPNIFTSNGNSAITFAMQKKHPETAIILLEYGADPNTLWVYTGQTLLQCAAANGYKELVRKLLEKGVNINMGDPTALELASRFGYVQIVKILLQEGADVNFNPDGKLNAVDEAKVEGHAQIVQLLKERGAVESRPQVDNSKAGNFHSSFVSHIKDPTLRRRFAFHEAGLYYQFGQGICDSLRTGASKKQILQDSYYHFWGKDLSDAMWAAALEVICPELSP
jgi:ankyrin repeat protein